MNPTVSDTLNSAPQLPKPFSLPLGLIPVAANSHVLANLLNRIFKTELEDGELAFLEGNNLRVRVTDAHLTYRITLVDGKLKTANGKEDHLSIDGTIYDFLLLASRREDADTLFFNRRLRLGGDTELGLYLKNFLDGIDLEERLGPLQKLLNGATDLIERLPKPRLPIPGPLHRKTS